MNSKYKFELRNTSKEDNTTQKFDPNTRGVYEHHKAIAKPNPKTPTKTLVIISVAVRPSGDPGWLNRTMVFGALKAKGADRRVAAAEDEDVVGAVVLVVGEAEALPMLEDYKGQMSRKGQGWHEKTSNDGKTRTVGDVFPVALVPATVFVPAFFDPLPAPTPATPAPAPAVVPPVVPPAFPPAV